MADESIYSIDYYSQKARYFTFYCITGLAVTT
jgi:hypothetical protein